MHAEHATIHDRAKRKVVKDFAAPPPHIRRAVLALALVVEAVDLRNLPRFMVAADERNAVRIPDLEREEEQEGFDAIEAAVDEIAYVCANARQ